MGGIYPCAFLVNSLGIKFSMEATNMWKQMHTIEDRELKLPSVSSFL
jgi:hypothetical protein